MCLQNNRVRWRQLKICSCCYDSSCSPHISLEWLIAYCRSSPETDEPHIDHPIIYWPKLRFTVSKHMITLTWLSFLVEDHINYKFWLPLRASYIKQATCPISWQLQLKIWPVRLTDHCKSDQLGVSTVDDENLWVIDDCFELRMFRVELLGMTGGRIRAWQVMYFRYW